MFLTYKKHRTSLTYTQVWAGRPDRGGYLINGNKSDKVEQTIKDAELIKQFKQLDKLPDDEKKSILKVIGALIRDFKARQAYVL